MAIKKHRVGIFSRDGEDSYSWLIDLLQAPMFHKVVEDVIPVYISNNFQAFQSALSKCTFAILYHTKNRGRLNITNVTDSLYDQELEYMSRHLGKENVIVLLDDPEDVSDNNKRRILQDQPLIDRFACALILISDAEKESFDFHGLDARGNQPPGSLQLQDEYDLLYKKICKLVDIMSHTPKSKAEFVDPRDSDGSSSENDYARQSRADQYSTKSSSVYSSGHHPRLLPASDRDTLTDVKESNEGHNGSRKTGNKSVFKLSKISDAKVFWIIGGLILILIIILIIILCFTV